MSDEGAGKISLHEIWIRGKPVKYMGTKAAADRYQASFSRPVGGDAVAPSRRVRATLSLRRSKSR